MDISELVKDWGGFERLVAKLHETGSVTVEHNVILKGRSGAPRQIDVLVRHKEGLHEYLTIIECKYWRRRVSRQQVDALAASKTDLNASRAVIFSSQDFQSGAIEQAAHDGISLFKVRDITDDEWGRPGRIVDLILQVIQLSAGKTELDFGEARAVPFRPPGRPLHLNVVLDGDGGETSTPLVKSERQQWDTLEQLLEDTIQQGAKKALPSGLTFNRGTEGKSFMTCDLVVRFQDEPVVFSDGVWVKVLGGRLELAFKISQSRIVVDRSEPYVFALAVEDCITREVSLASRTTGASATLLHTARSEPHADDVIQNGSVIRVVLKPYFDYSELDGKGSVTLTSLLGQDTASA